MPRPVAPETGGGLCSNPGLSHRGAAAGVRAGRPRTAAVPRCPAAVVRPQPRGAPQSARLRSGGGLLWRRRGTWSLSAVGSPCCWSPGGPGAGVSGEQAAPLALVSWLRSQHSLLCDSSAPFLQAPLPLLVPERP